MKFQAITRRNFMLITLQNGGQKTCHSNQTECGGRKKMRKRGERVVQISRQHNIENFTLMPTGKGLQVSFLFNFPPLCESQGCQIRGGSRFFKTDEVGQEKGRQGSLRREFGKFENRFARKLHCNKSPLSGWLLSKYKTPRLRVS